jgi:hypothetical protein
VDTLTFTSPATEGKRKLPWRKEFLLYYERTGRLYETLQAIGVSKDRFDRMCIKDPRFAKSVEVRRQRYVDGLEGQFDSMFKDPTRPNVIAGIVLAKKHRPQDFVERHQGLVVQAGVLASPDEARELLRTMLGDATEATRTRLALPAGTLVEDDSGVDGA